MVYYAYRCERHGPSEVAFALGCAPRVIPCPTCSAPAARAYSPPSLSRPKSARMSVGEAKERAKDTATNPPLVTRLPPARHSQAPPVDPARLARWSKLPRP